MTKLNEAAALVERARSLAAENPGAFEPELAMALCTLGVYQGKAAIATAQGATATYRSLAEAPPAFAADVGLRHYGLACGQRDAALASIQEAVAIYRRIAKARPAAFEPELARSLHSLSIREGDFDAALAASRDAVAIYRRIASRRQPAPVGFDPAA
jgi:tetratricopeptide (TPR) repeat protein